MSQIASTWSFPTLDLGGDFLVDPCRVLSHTPYQVEVLCLAAELAGEPEPGCYAFTLVRADNAWCIDRVEKCPLKAWVTP